MQFPFLQPPGQLQDTRFFFGGGAEADGPTSEHNMVSILKEADGVEAMPAAGADAFNISSPTFLLFADDAEGDDGLCTDGADAIPEAAAVAEVAELFFLVDFGFCAEATLLVFVFFCALFIVVVKAVREAVAEVVVKVFITAPVVVVELWLWLTFFFFFNVVAVVDAVSYFVKSMVDTTPAPVVDRFDLFVAELLLFISVTTRELEDLCAELDIDASPLVDAYGVDATPAIVAERFDAVGRSRLAFNALRRFFL